MFREQPLTQRTSVRSFRDLGDVETFDIMLHDNNSQSTANAGQISPKAKIRLQFTDIADAVSQENLEPVARDNEEASYCLSLLHRQEQLVQGSMAGRNVARLPLKGDIPLGRPLQRVEVAGSEDARSDAWKLFNQPAAGAKSLNARHLDELDAVSLSAFFTAFRVYGERP